MRDRHYLPSYELTDSEKQRLRAYTRLYLLEAATGQTFSTRERGHLMFLRWLVGSQRLTGDAEAMP